MIIDKIENLRLYEKLSPLFTKAFDYIEKTDFKQLELGKHSIDGEDVFALYMEYPTKDIQECLLEGHQKYIDVQYMIDGEEFIGITTLVDQIPHIPYNTEKDVSFYPNDSQQFILKAGNFTIFFPDDLHKPCVKVNEVSQVRKAVIKIRVDKSKLNS